MEEQQIINQATEEVTAIINTGIFPSVVDYTKKNEFSKARSYFKIAGINVCVESDLDRKQQKFKSELMAFAVDSPGDDNVTLRHHFGLPDLTGLDLGAEVYRRAPWAIYHKHDCWIYRGILPMVNEEALHRFAIFSADYKEAIIFSPPQSLVDIRENGFQSLSLFPTDQIWLAPLLAERDAVLLHSAAALINGLGFIFVGHSDAGKSTTMELLRNANCKKQLDVEILCDDRNIIRRWSDGWHVHGTWSHGDIADVSPNGAPLKGIFFLEQAPVNIIVPLTDRKQSWRRLLATLIKPMVTEKWWQQEIDIIEQIINQVPCYSMLFDKSGAIVSELERLSK